jgi:uncharacterized surface protein with fasciclin (FAS1) repeats
MRACRPHAEGQVEAVPEELATSLMGFMSQIPARGGSLSGLVIQPDRVIVLVSCSQAHRPQSSREETRMKKVFGAAGISLALIGSSSAYAVDIVDTAASNGSFKTLVAAVQAAGLVETLKGAGPFTVFAPTDAAFAALSAGTVESLLKPENKDKLTKVLTYHVIAGKVMSGDLKDGMKAATVEGAEVTIDLDGGAQVNDAKVVTADVTADNGVIHVIDKVLMPPM